MSDTNTGHWNTIFTNMVKVDFEEDLDLHGAKDKQLEETILQRVELHMIEPVNAHFKFLDEVEIYLIADGLDTVKIASDVSLHEQSDAKKIFVPLATDIDIEQYLRKDQIQYMVKFTQHEKTQIDHHIKVNSKVKVDSKRFGL